MLEVFCEGTSYGIGLQHGEQARPQIAGSLAFYSNLFAQKCSMDWPAVCTAAAKFVPFLETSFPEYMQEMRGVAQGADVPVESILALNVRTEIAYGMFSDGCTALSWKEGGKSFIAQNWDWDREQSPNLLSLHIRQSTPPGHPPKPAIHMLTEAGLIGKIGLNSAGVGVTLNAIKAHGVNFFKLPTHLALRAVLDSSSAAEAVEKVEKYGVAAACHILVADAQAGGVGLECSAGDVVGIRMGEEEGDAEGVITHSNHFIREHEGLKAGETRLYLPDSVERLGRIRELVRQKGKASVEGIEEILRDEKGYPTSICREVTEKESMATLFSVVMDLGAGRGYVRVGRPVKPEGILGLKP
ncbi:hypothetical protein AJ79_06454 [Helicocarpus griseus UAMH5409]|uniref:Peptidase C45 hydrolase domain-containing protein n=1 Tax=Helicocarpus griseus UAMH5409 TaxID=1447875 RepID=A0A2B7XDG8_9EURO|nr:hypothetical protein AJ79_06454 [Helicocarpus griseus UAMH5409]